MSATSLKGYVGQMAAGGMGDGYPVSTWKAWECRDNLMHLRDEFTQTRINWQPIVFSDGLLPGSIVQGEDPDTTGSNPLKAFTFSQEFAWTWLTPQFPANLDLLVKFSTSADAYNYHVNWQASIRSCASKVSSVETIAQTSGVQLVTGAMTTQSLIDGGWYWNVGNMPHPATQLIDRAVPSFEDGAETTVEMSFGRLDIRVWSDSSTSITYLTGVSLREYA